MRTGLFLIIGFQIGLSFLPERCQGHDEEASASKPTTVGRQSFGAPSGAQSEGRTRVKT